MAAGEDQMQGSSGREEKIFVSVRLRPLNVKERVKNEEADWECINDETVIYRSHLSLSERSMYPTAYTFDRVFGPECCTKEVYDQGAKEVALSVVSGVHASVFAYGQTSSGKTYTMSGITDYALADIYDYIAKHKEREFVLKLSAMEIYNESIRDLLSTDISSPLRLLDDPEKGTVVEKLTEETLRGWNHFKELLSICIDQRHIGETALNEVSSRSHQILRLTVESTAREYIANDKFSTLTATVNFIDLAGSERASQSLSAGTRLKEGGHINRSLLTLGTVIRKLSKGKTGHIPFRDSKLTRILQSSLGGNARTAIICTMSPARIHVEQSRNTLLFASCAKEVTTNAQVNIVMSDKVLVKHLQRELAKLESELRSPRQALVVSDTTALLMEKDLQIQKLNKEVFQLAQQLEGAHSRIDDLQQIIGESPIKEILSTDSEHANLVLGHQYPKLRVRSSWESLYITPESPVSAQRSSMISPQSTDHGSDENVFQLTDFRIDFDATIPGQQHLSYVTPGKFTKVRLNIRGAESTNNKGKPVDQEERLHEVDEPSEVGSEDTCTELRCIETESPGIIMSPEPNMLQDRSMAVNALPVCVPDSKNLRPPPEIVEEEEECVKEVTAVFIEPKEKSEPIKSSNLRRDPTLPDSVTLSPEKPYSLHLEKQRLGGVRHTRSRSCGTSFVSGSSSSLYEHERDANTPPNWYQKERAESNLKPSNIKRPPLPTHSSRMSMPANWFEKDFNRNQRTAAALDGVNKRKSSMNSSQVSSSSTPVSRLQTSGRASNSQEEGEESGPQRDKRIIHLSMEEIEQKFLALRSTKSFKDAAVDPIQDYLTTPLNWPLEFKRLEMEIIELWHACNVSMAHRSYFFLLFRGDEKDCLYMEVELRRLKYIRETFTNNSKAIENGRTLTSMSSLRALNRERYKLSQLMQKKLTREERENLFLRWGIGLNTKHRRLQLAHRVWSESKDIDHVRESASVVGKLMGFVDMDLASREMFGLNFSLKPRPKKSSLWKRSVLSLSIL
ncbi:PREDICTED: kinesin-like protein NACK1 isoform X1 [Brassica oleracea var. oleracea]|uniref:Kinesin motor domain-containing protein n=2 Tax=Brassica oleracea var. oleracea TaxID=109376 RepID=A0A0D3DDY0_BRAOL|nr:PREDICTED: kinesin-like protein NACK1 isoform X1 [Brassica oleracea var. oleracea]XP_013597802.1 PREDICTED: kinesin-like protein NACK1 isoform X1 [Brassica oleracea var. oleracea]